MSGSAEPRPPAGKPRPSLSSLLLDAGVVSNEQLQLAIAEGTATGERLGEVVLRRGWLDEEGLVRLLARQWGLPLLGSQDLERAVVQRGGPLTLAQARRLAAVVIRIDTEREPLLAVAEPAAERLNELRELLGYDAACVVVSPAELRRLLGELAATHADAATPHPDAEAEGRLARSAVEAASLLAELQQATASLAALGPSVEQVSARAGALERELAELRHEHERLRVECAAAKQRAEERAQELEHERERISAFRARLVDLLHQHDEPLRLERECGSAASRSSSSSPL